MPRLELDDGTYPDFRVPTFTAPEEADDSGSEQLPSTEQPWGSMSIVPGMSTMELLEAHRQTLSQMYADNKTELHSVTLSRRHMQPPDLYRSMIIEGLSDSLAGYNFGIEG
ncbi:uncharacterized protein TM35_000172740 [Trypanosoma theileri]|uniref:Uncharacterized protein n=1 Tax=Trypanosoma theileri TaxID=67003 RepID=A0A1X0NUP9_9TRYP|nr:uncharacterized protein TM35_000172740 [Trypanosoma theileri]ORC88402.1 hypothetical protein TM35_000172740 [Trypanosoma theileri]